MSNNIYTEEIADKIIEKILQNQVLVLIREFYKNENDFLYKY